MESRVRRQEHARPPDQPPERRQRILATCNICNKEMRKDKLQEHLRVHKKPCRLCKKIKTSTKKLIKHEKKCRRKITNVNFDHDFQASFNCEKAINGRFMIFSIDPNNDELDYEASI